MAGLADAFSRGFNNVAGDSLAALSTQGDMIQTQMDRIAGSTPGRVISTGWNALFGDGPTSLRGKFNSFVTQFEAGWNTTFGEQGTIATLWATFKSTIDISVADVGRVFSEFSLASLITTFRGAVGLDNIGIPGIVNRFRQTIHQNFDSGGLLGVIFGAFSLENIRSTFSTVFGEEGTIRGYLNSLLDFVTGFFSGEGLFAQAFAAFGDTLRPVFLDPVLGVFNGLIDMVIDVFNRVIDVVDSALGRIEDAARFTGLNVDFGLDHMNSGDYHLSLPGAKIGGVFGPGLLKTHKDEVIASGASKLTVFPVRWVKAMERIASGVTPTPRYATGVGSTSSSTVNNTANSHTVNFNVRDNRQNYRMKLSEARAFGWSH
jgi:hypothetical protein